MKSIIQKHEMVIVYFLMAILFIIVGSGIHKGILKHNVPAVGVFVLGGILGLMLFMEKYQLIPKKK